MAKIVLNIPHSSTVGIFDNETGKWPRNLEFINKTVARLTDWHTEFLFAHDDERIVSVMCPVSRFVCDVERLQDDPLEALGQGILYTRCGGFERGELSQKAKDHLEHLYYAHMRAVFREIEEGSILIDCHSFSPTDDNAPDICIGHNDDWSYDASIVELIKNCFEEAGYSVAINSPYSHSYAPENGLLTYKSVMIEVNKRVYMDEKTLRLFPDSEQCTRWFKCMNRIYEQLLKSDITLSTNKTTTIEMKEEVKFPEGKIVLTDGRELECYPIDKADASLSQNEQLNVDATEQKPSTDYGMLSRTNCNNGYSSTTHSICLTIRSEL